MKQKKILSNFLEIWKTIASHYGISWKPSFIQWDLPSKVSADFSLTLALPISYKTKQNPQKIAEEIAKNFDHSSLELLITEHGYINFRFPLNYHQDFLWETYQTEGKNLHGKKKNIKLNIEYVSANPTGYLHLAHFRHAVIGDTLANVYQFLGYDVIREYYINDRGGQILSLIKSVYFFYCQFQGIASHQEEKIEYLGKSSQEIAKILIEKWGNKYIDRDLNNEELIVWKKEILEIILVKIRRDLAKCGINFDIWFSETSLYEKNKGLELLNELKAKDLIYFQSGATFFRSSLSGDEKDRVIIKQGEDYTYFFSDILYHRNKLERSDKIINVWGADHHGYIGRIKGACQLLDYKPENIQIILVQVVNLLDKEGKNGKFSKRLGNTIDLEEALSYLDINQLKFFLLEKEPDQPLSINVDLLKENQKKTRLYYIQYAHARCHQIFQKAQEKNIEKISSNIDLLREEGERKIFNLLIRFSFILENIIEENKSHYLINYLYELARNWQIYYQNNIILDSENLELTSQKLLLVKNIQIILKLGLELIGIEAPNRM